MVTILPHTTRASGTLLTATIYNADHQNHVTNATTINTTAAYKDVGNTFTVGQTMPNLNITSTNGVHRDVNNSVLVLSGGNANVGGTIDIYGSTHATTPNQIFYDASSHLFRDVSGGATAAVTINGQTVWHAGNAPASANVALLGGQNGAFYQNSSNQNAGTLSDARLPTTLAGKTFSSAVTVSTSVDHSTFVSSGSIELYRNLGAFLDFKDVAAEDFDVRLQHTGVADLTMTTNGSGNLVIDGKIVVVENATTAAPRINVNQLSHTGSLIIGDNGTEDFRFNADAFLSNGLTVTKNAIVDAGSGVSIQQGGIIWCSRDGLSGGFYNRDTSDGVLMQFGRSKTAVGSISVTTTATAYNTSSDISLKQDFQPINPALFDMVKVYDFEWKATGKRGYGVIAQELVEFLPQAVSQNEETDLLEVDYSKLVPLLFAKIHQLEERLAVLEA